MGMRVTPEQAETASRAASDTVSHVEAKVSDAVSNAKSTAVAVLVNLDKKFVGGSKNVSNFAENIQKKVEGFVRDDFEKSAIGNNVVGHFVGGVAETAVGVATGLAGLAGGVGQLAGHEGREHFKEVAWLVTHHPGAVATHVKDSIVQAYKDDHSTAHAHFAGQVVGEIGGMFVAGEAIGKVAEGVKAASGIGRASEIAGKATTVLETASPPSKLSQTLGKVGNQILGLSDDATAAMSSAVKGISPQSDAPGSAKKTH